jgi:hypothetical protein
MIILHVDNAKPHHLKVAVQKRVESIMTKARILRLIPAFPRLTFIYSATEKTSSGKGITIMRINYFE